ncbi:MULTISPECIES: hypothetical protein [unclassified Sphingomonas]|jgi:DNA polymerase III subunit epsilon|nr:MULTISPECIES: hypothetical protein [unclassified Sphingomonas]AXJ96371.1 hypothetical protein DM480_13615 [Sphingomonas sp. FARSPH]
MLIGQWIRDVEVEQVLDGVHAVVAHNVRFDRAFVTKRLPVFADLPWACSMREVDWAEHGLGGGRSVAGLLTQAGFFLPDAHRAAADVWATTCLLAMTASDGRAIAAHLVETAQRPTQRLWANRAPFGCKDVLKAAGYSWSPERRAWWIEREAETVDHEAVWLKELSNAVQPDVERIDWYNRH